MHKPLHTTETSIAASSFTGGGGDSCCAGVLDSVAFCPNITVKLIYHLLFTCFKHLWTVCSGPRQHWPWRSYQFITVTVLVCSSNLTRCSKRSVLNHIPSIGKVQHDVVKRQIPLRRCSRRFDQISLFALQFCVFLSALCSCNGAQFPQTRPRVFGPIKQFGSPRSREPRVQMPPLDLGFRGQTSAQIDKPELLNGYQSDESSSGSRWDLVGMDREESGPIYRKQLSGYVNHEQSKMHLSGPKKTPRSSNRPYMEPRRFNDRTNVNQYGSNQFGHPNEWSGTPYGMFEPSGRYQGNSRIAANPNYPPPFVRNAKPSEYFLPGQDDNRHLDHPYDPDTYDTRPYPYFNQFPPDMEESIDGNDYYKDSPPVAAHRAIGHESNYQTITEEEIARHMKEYQDDRKSRSDVQLPRLPPIGEPIRSSNVYNVDATDPSSSNHLVLSGSQAHDQLAQRFLCAASSFTSAGVETLFDEIDTNHDGTIRLEELRNFVWLHEVVAPR